MTDVISTRSLPSDRAAVERTAHELVLDVARRRTPTGISIVIEGAPGIGKTFLARRILDSIPPGAAKVLIVAGEQGRRNAPFAGAGQLAGDMPGCGDPGEAAFDRVDELCADGPVVLCADDAHNLDAATLTLIRRLVWASGSLPLAVLVNTRPYPSRDPLTMLIGQAQVPWTRPWPATGGSAPSRTGTAPWPGPARWASGGAPGSPAGTQTSAGPA